MRTELIEAVKEFSMLHISTVSSVGYMVIALTWAVCILSIVTYEKGRRNEAYVRALALVLRTEIAKQKPKDAETYASLNYSSDGAVEIDLQEQFSIGQIDGIDCIELPAGYIAEIENNHIYLKRVKG